MYSDDTKEADFLRALELKTLLDSNKELFECIYASKDTETRRLCCRYKIIGEEVQIYFATSNVICFNIYFLTICNDRCIDIPIVFEKCPKKVRKFLMFNLDLFSK